MRDEYKTKLAQEMVRSPFVWRYCVANIQDAESVL